jgi:SAM-dependent methyltransferase
MSSGPTDFHRGLAARPWASIEGGPEVDYFRGVIHASGEPALDAGCGAGRLLVPYLRDGLDVDGCDVSPDMLAICRERADAQGLDPTLYEQPMHALDLPRQYRTIFVCGAFGLGTERDEDMEALRRLHRHLVPGGALAIDFEVPWSDAGVWQYWTPDKRGDLPVPLSSNEWTQPDGSLVKWISDLESVDPLERLVTQRVRFEQWRNGTLEREEVRVLKAREQFPTEFRLMLEVAGFRGIELEGNYEHRPPTADDAFLVFLART